MNKKLHDMMAHFCYHISHKSDLSKARLTKLVYLADWKMSQINGRQISDIYWLFNHYGPYVDDVAKLAFNSTDFLITQTKNPYGSLKEEFIFRGDILQCQSLDANEIRIINDVIAETEPLYFNKFIQHVYATYPVENSNRYSVLNLPKLAKKEKMVNKPINWD
jgi:uncharacterized protein YwgA